MRLCSFILNVAEKLDRRSFLQYRLWKFSILNFIRFFPHYFFFRIMAMHPLTALNGIKRYRRLVSESGGDELRGTLNMADWGGQIESPFLLGLGFCLKPMDHENGNCLCPAGFFNHRCRILEQSSAALADDSLWPAPCLKCGIAPFIRTAVQFGMDIYIMTSALDIARHVFLPAMRKTGARRGIFFLCPYSAEPFTFGLAITHILGRIIVFGEGNCQDHQEWTCADRGIKKKQTTIEPLGLSEWRQRFQSISPAAAYQFIREREVYRAEKQERVI